MTAELDSLKQQVLERRRRRRDLRDRLNANAECVTFERWQWYRLPVVAGKLGIKRARLYRHTDELTTKRTSENGGTNMIYADERLEALARKLYINIQLLDRQIDS